MFENFETIALLPKTAQEFGIIKQLQPSRKKAYTFHAVELSESEHSFSVTGKIDSKEVTLTYNKATLTDREKVFIAYVYLASGDHELRNKNKEKAAALLSQALKGDLEISFKKRKARPEFVFPYYLIARYDIEISEIRDTRSELYRFLKLKEALFPDFYREILRYEKNPVRKSSLLQVAEKNYPKDTSLIHQIAEDLFKQQKYRECIKYMYSVKKRFANKKDWSQVDARITLWRALIEVKNYKAALNELEIEVREYYFDEDYTALLKGLTFVCLKKWPEAIKCFEDVIFLDSRDSEISSLASYGIINCSLETRNHVRAEQMISNLVLREDDFIVYGLAYEYTDYAISVLQKVIKSRNVGEEHVNRAKGLMAHAMYRSYTDKLGTNTERKRTSKEKSDLERIAKSLNEALEFYPNDTFFNAFYSNILHEQKKFDLAMDYKLKSLLKDRRSFSMFSYADLAHCSEEYLLDYPNKIKHLFKDTDFSPTIGVSGKRRPCSDEWRKSPKTPRYKIRLRFSAKHVANIRTCSAQTYERR